MPSPLPSVDRVALPGHVYLLIYENLINLAFSPDARITIDRIARDLQVSPTPVREALARLEGEELVVKRPLAGYLAAPLMPKRALAELYDLRIHIEPWLAALAARRDDESRAQLIDVSMSASGADSIDGVAATARADAELHDRVAVLSQNASARNALRRLHSHFHVFRHTASHELTANSERDSEHGQIIDAIVEGNEKAASAGMHAHLTAARDRILTTDD